MISIDIHPDQVEVNVLEDFITIRFESGGSMVYIYPGGRGASCIGAVRDLAAKLTAAAESLENASPVVVESSLSDDAVVSERPETDIPF